MTKHVPSRIMTTSDYIQQLTQFFDDKFRRPTSFYNNGCCVGDDDEQLLIDTPRAQLTEQMLRMPIDHFGSCFGTFEQISYFVPRLMELLYESENGFQYGCLNYTVFRLLVENEQQYRDLGLWDVIENTMYSILADRTSTFVLTDRGDTVGSDMLKDLLEGFFQPVLQSKTSLSSACMTQWDEFIAKWADDEVPHMIAHLLSLVSWQIVVTDHILPESFMTRLKDQSYSSSLIKRAEPALVSMPSEYWLYVVRECLEEWSAV